jgi:uncharacterized protein YbjT (DUF2867 family)
MRALVTGATGLIGSQLSAVLSASGVKVRAAGRSVTTDDLAGIDVLFVHPRAVGLGAADLVKRAAESGVRRVVVLSAVNVDDDLKLQPSRWNGDRNKEVEDAVTTGELPWVAVRSASFATNTLGMFGAQIRAGDVVRGPYGDFAEALIDDADLAAVLAHTVITDGYDGQRLSVTGPQSLSQKELVTIIGEVIGRPLRFEEVPPEVAVRGMVANGLPEAFASALMRRYARGAGPAESVTDTVQRLLCKPARTFADWVSVHQWA